LLRILTADRGDAGERLDLMLRRHLSDVQAATRTRVQSWIEHGRVTINATVVRRVSTRTATGDIVAITLPESAAPAVMLQEAIPLDILYEDETLLALNKPAGIVVHPTYKHTEHTIMNGLLWHARDWPPPARPSIVGRLDKLTSGLVIVAKTAAAHAALQRALTLKNGEKDYLAVVYGQVSAARGTIDLRLARDPGDRRRVVASATTGVPSLTEFERLLTTNADGAPLTLLRCRLVTGRMHQIRVHLAASGWPIVGDPKYGTPSSSRVADPVRSERLCAFSRQALHAWRVSMRHPVTGTRLILEAPLPDDFRALLAEAFDIPDGTWPPPAPSRLE
jgi:23S rRNA pseudouridine1911/1915/1917 synthase